MVAEDVAQDIEEAVVAGIACRLTTEQSFCQTLAGPLFKTRLTSYGLRLIFM